MLKSILLAFWSAWFSLAAISNFFDFLCLYFSNPLFKGFRSGNFSALCSALSTYGKNFYFSTTLFLADITIQLIGACIFLISTIRFFKNYKDTFYEYAFMITMSLWLIFILLEEVFIAYQFESTHIRLFLFEIFCLTFIRLYPSQSKDIKVIQHAK